MPHQANDDSTSILACSFHLGISIGQKHQALGRESVAAFFKQELGNPDFVYLSQGRSYSADDLSALILRQLKLQAER